ncbi:aspartic peptidase domain-containing protein [Lipomyces orientalis]|uniref:Aspartic peptidase domain-containing protein n=1 Tax=Lipomyces orientalis TaxID=1233043 RepID=A0ACC3TK69_9ASCO
MRHFVQLTSLPPPGQTWLIFILCVLLDTVQSQNDDSPFQRRLPKGTVLLPIEASYHARRSGLVKEFDVLAHSTFETPYNDRWKFSYLANISLGTPPQTVALQLDSKSANIWVQSSENPACRQADLEFCAITKTYNRVRSTTANSTHLEGQLQYEDSTYARVHAVQDVATIGDQQLPSLIFGISSESTAVYGRLGLRQSEQTGSAGPDTLQNKLLEYGVF